MKKLYRLPEGFKFGSSASAWQTEGWTGKKEHQRNFVDMMYLAEPERWFNGVGTIKSTDFYNRYEEDIKLMNEMVQFIINSQTPEIAEKYQLRESVGLAAPQLNLDKRIIAVHTEDEKGKLYSLALANPKIISYSEEMTYLPMGEGCLSVDREVEGFVPRYRRITVQGYNVKGQLIKIRLRDYVSIVFQHEIDHLNGHLFVDRINKEKPLAPIPNAKPLEF